MTTDASVSPSVPDQLYILPASLLETQRALVTDFRTLASRVGVAPGWHYPLDLVWAADVLQTLGVQGGRVLDAGAGIGLMQWWLATHGAEVLSVDRESRHFSRRMRALTIVRGSPDQIPSLRQSAWRTVRNVEGLSLAKWAWRSTRVMRDLVLGDPQPRGSAQSLQRSRTCETWATSSRIQSMLLCPSHRSSTTPSRTCRW